LEQWSKSLYEGGEPMNGWAGRILRVDLSRISSTVQDLDPALPKRFIGGRGLAVKILFDEGIATVDPLSPENKLVFAVGPLTGTKAVSSGRYMVVTKSPLTGAIAFSNSGGQFGVRMKTAGYDLIIVEGKAPEPVYLDLTSDDVRIEPALHLWGKTTHETEDLIRGEFTDISEANRCSIASIGPAGEKLVLFSAVINDKHRAAARSGVGAVMGSKNLKAIVAGGNRSVALADAKGFEQSVALTREMVKQSKGMQTLGEYGTPFLVDIVSRAGIHTTKNFQGGVFYEADKINGDSMRESIVVGHKACLYCPIGCGRKTKISSGNFTREGEGPEYETISMLGVSCGVNDLIAITEAGYICNELGLDTISTGGTIACAMELYERGILTEKDIGYPLHFGDGKALVRMTEEIGKRKGFGNVLAEGSYRMAKKYGHPEVAMTSKKLEFPGYDPRGIQERGLAYATSNRGACHMRGRTLGAELEDPFTSQGKAPLLMAGQDYLAIMDSSGVCCLTRGVITVDYFLPVLESATGAGYDRESLLLAGERIWNQERLFNLKAGLTKDDDSLPNRMLKDPMPLGPAKGQVVELEPMLAEYYQVRGWDKNGVITKDKLTELGLV
jgi:aldehyde:ferredoxin oxidoreductase